jgi:hypothetical protein
MLFLLILKLNTYCSFILFKIKTKLRMIKYNKSEKISIKRLFDTYNYS